MFGFILKYRDFVGAEPLKKRREVVDGIVRTKNPAFQFVFCFKEFALKTIRLPAVCVSDVTPSYEPQALHVEIIHVPNEQKFSGIRKRESLNLV